MDPVPDESLPLMSGVFNVPIYGLTRWGDLFNARQKLALITFAEKVRRAHAEMLRQGADPEFARAVATYLALAIDRLADFFATLCQWENTRGNIKHVFTRQALPMLWDYVEANPFSAASGGAHEQFDSIIHVLSHVSDITSPPSPEAAGEGPGVRVLHGSATALPWPDNYFDAVLTDPPYYINVPYADLSDFFYVWLKRTVGDIYPDLFATPLTPKSQEIGQMAHWDPNRYSVKDKAWFEEMLTKAFLEIRRVLKPDGISIIVFAYPKTDAWEAIINAQINAGLYLTASWPIHTEMVSRLRAQESAALASSIYMVCRKRTGSEIGEYPKVRREIEARVRQKLEQFWAEGIRGADFFMSAIGPAVEAFGRYARVEKLSGEPVTVRELLEYVQRAVAEYALQRILHSSNLSGVDALTRFYLLWRWAYNAARVPFDEARKMAMGTGVELTEHWGAGGLVHQEGEYVRVRSPQERMQDEAFMQRERYETMVDALHCACGLWSANQTARLREHLTQTYGGNEMFWQVVQAMSEVLPSGDKEKQVLQGLLNAYRSVSLSQLSLLEEA